MRNENVPLRFGGTRAYPNALVLGHVWRSTNRAPKLDTYPRVGTTAPSRMITGPDLPSLDAPPLRLRMLTAEDASALFTIFSDAEAMRYWSRPAMTAIAEAQGLVAEIQACARARTLFQWGVTLVDTDEVIGTCTLSSLDWSNRRAEVGFMLRRSYWGRGFARRAVSRMIELAFDTLDLHRLEADVDPRNEASLALLRRLGFVHEGVLRERWIVAGQICDSVMLGLLRAEWQRQHTRA